MANNGKGIGPRGLGAPKSMAKYGSMAKQTKDSKSGKKLSNNFKSTFSTDPDFGSRYKKKKVSRDVVRKKDIMDSDVGKDAFKTVAKGATGITEDAISSLALEKGARVPGTFKRQLITVGEVDEEYGDPFSDTVKTYNTGEAYGFKTGGRASQAFGKMGAKRYEKKYGKL